MTAVAAPERYDALVIGSGQASGQLSRALAGSGRRTAVIEREHVGGTCVNEGCTPTKTMVASARVAYLARRAADYGVRTGPVTVEMARVRQRKRDIVTRFRTHGEQSLRQVRNLELIMGHARFTGPKMVEARLDGGSVRTLTADLIFIDVGNRPARPPLPGLDLVPALDSTSIMELDQVPEHLLVLGGGYIAMEFGQMFRRFGSRVTVVQRAGHVLNQEDPDVSEEVEKILRDDGVEILLQADARRVDRAADGQVLLTVRTPQDREPRTLTGSHLLVAVGRVPNTDTLNLPATGVDADAQGFIKVNERLETSAPGIYGLGDAKGGPAFTHISYDDYRVIDANLLKGGHATVTNRLVPYVVFIDPELGRVGLSETDARRQNRAVRLYKMPMRQVARALEMDEPRGFMKAVVDSGSGQILGCTMLGIWGGELMSMVELAMMGRLPFTALRDAVFAHPTLAEALNNLFDV